jgi:hypothetical protein
LLDKHHLTAAKLTYSTVEKLLKAGFTILSTATAISHCKKATAKTVVSFAEL